MPPAAGQRKDSPYLACLVALEEAVALAPVARSVALPQAFFYQKPSSYPILSIITLPNTWFMVLFMVFSSPLTHHENILASVPFSFLFVGPVSPRISPANKAMP